jgi:hypothetical protein
VARFGSAGALITVALALGAPTVASAAPLAPVGKTWATYPLFAGEQLLVGSDVRLAAVTEAGTFRKLLALRQTATLRPEIDSIDATDGRLAFVVFGQGEDGDILWSTLQTGPLDGPFPVIAGDKQVRFGPARLNGPQSAALGAGGVAYVDHTGSGLDVVWRASDGTKFTLAQNRGSAGVAANDRYVAVDSDGRIDVYDITTHTFIYTVALGSASSVVVDGNGAVAAVDREGKLWTASPADPAPVARASGARSVLGMSNGSVRYVKDLGRYLMEGRQLDLAIGEEHAFTPALPSTPNGSSEIAVTDHSLAWIDGTTTCLYRGDLPQAPAWPVGRGCRPRMYSVVGAPVHHRSPATIACPGGPTDVCAGSMQWLVTRRHHRRRVVATWTFSLAGGETADHSARIPKRARGTLYDRVRMASQSTAGGNTTDYLDELTGSAATR